MTLELLTFQDQIFRDQQIYDVVFGQHQQGVSILREKSLKWTFMVCHCVIFKAKAFELRSSDEIIDFLMLNSVKRLTKIFKHFKLGQILFKNLKTPNFRFQVSRFLIQKVPKLKVLGFFLNLALNSALQIDYLKMKNMTNEKH